MVGGCRVSSTEEKRKDGRKSTKCKKIAVLLHLLDWKSLIDNDGGD